MKHRAPRSKMGTLALVGILGLALTGCAASGAGDSSPAPDRSSEYAHSVEGALSSPEAAGAVGEEVMKNAQAAAPGGRAESRVIVSGSLHLSVDDPAEASASAQEIVTNAGGRIDFTSQTSTQTRSAHATYRIPAADYDSTLAELRELGTVTREEIHSEEVGARIADLDARAAALQSSIDRLSELMKSAGSTSELLEAERELTSRQADLDALKAERAWYEDEVEYSTLDVEFSSSSVTPAPSIGAWGRSWQIFSEGMKALGYAAIILLPWILLASVVLALLRLLWRRRRRARPVRSGARRAKGAAAEPDPASAELAPGPQDGGEHDRAELGGAPRAPRDAQDGGEEAADEA